MHVATEQRFGDRSHPTDLRTAMALGHDLAQRLVEKQRNSCRRSDSEGYWTGALSDVSRDPSAFAHIKTVGKSYARLVMVPGSLLITFVL